MLNPNFSQMNAGEGYKMGMRLCVINLQIKYVCIQFKLGIWITHTPYFDLHTNPLEGYIIITVSL
jgi:hypothetical protein